MKELSDFLTKTYGIILLSLGIQRSKDSLIFNYRGDNYTILFTDIPSDKTSTLEFKLDFLYKIHKFSLGA